jgi:TPR repeat protein
MEDIFMKKSLALFKKKDKSDKKVAPSPNSPASTQPSAPPLEALNSGNTAANKGSYTQILSNLPNPDHAKSWAPGEKEFLDGERLYNVSHYYEALECYEESIRQGYFAAYFRCWVIHDQFLPEKNPDMIAKFLLLVEKEGFPKCFQEAGTNNPTAKYILGCYHFYGIAPTGKDYLAAVKLFKEAANAGHSFAQNILGACYEYGLGATKDLEVAATLYKKSADQGIAWGEWHFGVCLLYGLGIKKDAKKGISFIELAVEKGLADALNELGYCYMHGKGVAKNHKKAAELFAVSAEKGNADAMCSIGACYDNGHGVEKSRGSAMGWFKKAAAKGHETAISNIKSIEEGKKQPARWHYHYYYFNNN